MTDFKPTLCIDTHEIAWAAGFFDGEGTTLLRRRPGTTWRELWVSVSQSSGTPEPPRSLQRFHEATLKLGTLGGPWTPSWRGAKPTYRIDFRGYRQAQAAIALLWRFLSEEKRIQDHRAFTDCRDYFQMRAERGSKGRAKLTMTQAEQLRADYQSAGMQRGRVPRGFMATQAEKYNVSPHTISHICQGRGYV